ncbi:hypothetical protein Tco_1052612 [Tanacetum coccineum]
MHYLWRCVRDEIVSKWITKALSLNALKALRRLKGTSNSIKEKMSAKTKAVFDQLTEDAMKLMEDGDYNVYHEKQEDGANWDKAIWSTNVSSKRQCIREPQSTLVSQPELQACSNDIELPEREGSSVHSVAKLASPLCGDQHMASTSVNNMGSMFKLSVFDQLAVDLISNWVEDMSRRPHSRSVASTYSRIALRLTPSTALAAAELAILKSTSAGNGVLSDGREINVRRLYFNNNRLRAADFYNEITMISSVEHKKLVRLLERSNANDNHHRTQFSQPKTTPADRSAAERGPTTSLHLQS